MYRRESARRMREDASTRQSMQRATSSATSLLLASAHVHVATRSLGRGGRPRSRPGGLGSLELCCDVLCIGAILGKVVHPVKCVGLGG